MRGWVAVGLSCLALCAVRADDILLQNGKTIRCQVYKETDETVFYVDAAKDECGQVARKDVQKIEKSEKPVVDLKAFLERQGDKLSAEQKADITACANKPKSKLTMRTMDSGVTVKKGADPNTPELVVDPFPEQGAAKPKKTAPQQPKK